MGDANPELLEFGRDFGPGTRFGAWLGHDHDVAAREPGLRLAKAFADLALEAIAIHRPRCLLAGDGQAQPGCLFLWRRNSGQPGADFPTTAFEDPFKLRGLQQPRAPFEARHGLGEKQIVER